MSMICRMLVALFLCYAPAALAQSSPPAADQETIVLRGQVVTDDEFATPLRGARVAIVSDGTSAPATSDAQGQFAALVPAQDDWSIRVTKAGYAPAALTRAQSTGEAAIIRMVRGAVITGRVIDERGEPVAGVTVAVRPEACAEPCPARDGSPPGAFVSSTETDDLGEYRIGSLSAGRYEVRHAQGNALDSALLI